MTRHSFRLTILHRLLLSCIVLSSLVVALAQGGSAPQGNNFGEIAQLVPLGSAVSLVASVTSASPMTFTWTKDGRLVRDAYTTALTLPAVTKESAGSYRLKARNAFGSWESPPFLLGVYETGMAEATLISGKSLRLEPRAWGPGLKFSWSSSGYEDTPSHSTATFQINRLPHGIHTAVVSIVMGESGPEASGFSYLIKSVGRPRAPTADRVWRMELGQAYLDEGELPTDEIPVTFYAKGLPPGITINATSGDITGTPTRAGDYIAELWTSDGYGTSPRVQQIYFVGSNKIDLFTRSYCGTLYQLPIENGQSGYLAEFTVTPSGKYSAKLTFKSRVIRLSGSFTADASAYISNATNVTLGLNLKMTLRPAEGVILEWSDPLGLISDSYHEIGAVFRQSGDPYTDPSGRHGVLMRPEQITESVAAEVMRGTGFGSLLVNANFSTTFVGSLPDGQGVTASSYVTTNGTIPAFLIPPAKRDVVIGDLYVPTRYELTNPHSVWWYRDANPSDPIAPAGWSRNIATEVTPYTPPTAGRLLLPFMEDRPNNAFISLSSAGRDSEVSTAFIDTDFRLTSTHTARFSLPNPSALRVDFYAPTGFFTGQATLDDPHPTIPLRRVRRAVGFRGMMFQNPDSPHGEGYFLAPSSPDTVSSSTVSGHVWIGPSFAE